VNFKKSQKSYFYALENFERIFLRRASDSIFNFLAFLQQWYPLCRQRDKERLDNMLEDLLMAARHTSLQSGR
jgi:hypothetical protein